MHENDLSLLERIIIGLLVFCMMMIAGHEAYLKGVRDGRMQVTHEINNSIDNPCPDVLQ